MYVDGRKQAEQAAEFLRKMPEVKNVDIEHSQEEVQNNMRLPRPSTTDF